MSGSSLPSERTPSTSIAPEPIIQSMWMRLRLVPRADSSASLSLSPVRMQFD